MIYDDKVDFDFEKIFALKKKEVILEQTVINKDGSLSKSRDDVVEPVETRSPKKSDTKKKKSVNETENKQKLGREKPAQKGTGKMADEIEDESE